MLPDGVYGLSFSGLQARGHGLAGPDGEALAVLRDGKILGSDCWGAVFSGTYEFDPVAQEGKVTICIDVPPEGELITGFAAGPDGATFEVVAALQQPAPTACARVEIGGQVLDIEFSFIGPLPH